MDRRLFLRLAGGGMIAVATGVRHLAPAGAVDDGAYPRLAWEPTATSPVLSVPSVAGDPNTQRMFPTLLPAGALLSNPLDAWYLWLWTHDTSRIYLYTAPTAAGPYTARGFGLPPTPYPSGYLAGHFSSGDIVWDPAGSRLVSSPHGIRLPQVPGNGEVSQDSFLIESTDGVSWSWLDGDNRPRLRCGPVGSPDSVHTGYGRLLRDLDGHLMTFGGRHWWFYRAQRKDAPVQGINQPTYYTPYLANAPALSSDFTTKQKAFDTDQASTNLFDVGTFVRAASVHHVFQVQGTAVTFPTAAKYNRTGVDDMTFLPQAAPLALPKPGEGAVLSGGPNVIRDPATREQYLVQVATYLDPARTEVWIYRGVAS